MLAGNDEEQYRPVLEDLARALGVHDRIEFTGAVSGAGKAALLHHARLLVLPSYSENFGNVVLEAMSAGRPVIVTPEVGVADIVRENDAGMVADGDPGTLGRALESLFTNATERERLGGNGRTAAERRFTWDAVAAQMESLYQQVARPC